MARTAITGTRIAETGTDVAANDVAAEITDGNSFVWADHRLLYVLNGDDAALTVTIPTPATVGRSALAIGDGGGSVPAGAWRLFGPFGSEYKQADGTVHVNYAGTTPTGVMVNVLDA